MKEVTNPVAPKSYTIPLPEGGYHTVKVHAFSTSVNPQIIQVFDYEGNYYASIHGHNREVLFKGRKLKCLELFCIYELTKNFDMHYRNILNLKANES